MLTDASIQTLPMPELSPRGSSAATAAFSEIDKFPRAVLAHHYPDVPLHGDFTTIRGDEYGPIDLLVGGTPCQDFSIAGLRAGIAGERGNLTLEFLRLAARAKPRWVVWENVLGVLSSDGGRALGAFLGGLAELGYGFAYRVLDAQYFGVAQRRARVFVVGHLGDWRRAAAVLFERESLQGHPAPRREAGEGIARPITPGSPGGSGYRNDAGTADNVIAGTLQAGGKAAGSATQQDAESGLLIAFGSANTSGPIDVAAGLNAHPGGSWDFESETFIAHSLRAGGFDKSHANGGVMPAVAFESRFARNGRGAPDTIVPPLKAQSGTNGKGDGEPLVAFTQNSRSEVRQIGGDGQITGAVAADADADAGAQQQNYVASSMAVRRLTPRECERLQGFPDDYTLIPYRGKPAADGPRYKALGNSMAVPVMAWIGRRIALVEQLARTA